MDMPKTIRLFSGLTLMVIATLAIGVGGVFMVPPAVFIAMIAGLLLYPWIAAPVVHFFDSFLWSGKAAEPPEQFTRVRALIVQRQFTEAESELRTRLEHRPDLLEGRILLASLLYEKLHRPEDALAEIRAELENIWRPDCEKLVLLGTDILLDLNRQEDAIALLQAGAAKAVGTPAAARLNERLQHLSANSSQ